MSEYTDEFLWAYLKSTRIMTVSRVTKDGQDYMMTNFSMSDKAMGEIMDIEDAIAAKFGQKV